MASVSVLREVCWVSAFHFSSASITMIRSRLFFFFFETSTQIVYALTELFVILWHVCIGQWKEMGMGIH